MTCGGSQKKTCIGIHDITDSICVTHKVTADDVLQCFACGMTLLSVQQQSACVGTAFDGGNSLVKSLSVFIAHFSDISGKNSK